MMRTRSLAVLLLAPLLAVVACSSEADIDKLEAAIMDEAVATFPSLTIEGVICPEEVELGAENDFSCVLQLEGDELTIDIDQTDDDGNVTLSQREAVIDLVKATEVIGKGLAERAGVPVDVDCGEGAFRVEPVDATFTCEVSDGERDATVEVTVVDSEGNVTWQLVAG